MRDTPKTSEGGGRIAATARLTVRRLGLADADFILELLNEPAFIRFIGDKGVRTLDDARLYLRDGPLASYENNGYGLYAVEIADGTRVGLCGLVRRPGLDHTDLGFAFLARHRGCGYACESAAAVLRHAHRDLNIGYLVAITDPMNLASIAVLGKVGFRFQGRIRLDPQDIDLNLYSQELAAVPHAV